jgi:hypothetical protein
MQILSAQFYYIDVVLAMHIPLFDSFGYEHRIIDKRESPRLAIREATKPNNRMGEIILADPTRFALLKRHAGARRFTL